jgi:catechol 2,3-dioxygenase-like lactoylglutathione lyase family enzyme
MVADNPIWGEERIATVRVPDLHRTSHFYQEFLGMPLGQQSAKIHILGTGNSFLGIEQSEFRDPDEFQVQLNAPDYLDHVSSTAHSSLFPRLLIVHAAMPSSQGISEPLSQSMNAF